MKEWMKRFYCINCKSYFQDASAQICPVCGSNNIVFVETFPKVDKSYSDVEDRYRRIKGELQDIEFTEENTDKIITFLKGLKEK